METWLGLRDQGAIIETPVKLLLQPHTSLIGLPTAYIDITLPDSMLADPPRC